MATYITLSTNTSPPVSNVYQLITIPSYPGFQSFDVTFMDTVGKVVSPFVPSSVQTQAWPGADSWKIAVTTPKMDRFTAAKWRAFFAGLQGIQNVFQIGDPIVTTPGGIATGAPVCAAGNTIMSHSLLTSGWTPDTFGQLVAGDYIQVGYRLYMVTDDAVASDSEGNATIGVWPSLRENHASGTALTLANTQGVFRLTSNARTWHLETSKLTQFSFECEEVR